VDPLTLADAGDLRRRISQCETFGLQPSNYVWLVVIGLSIP
jgi:hypothetical protein